MVCANFQGGGYLEKKIAVILSGQGASGFAGIALMEFFEEHNLKPDILIGASSSALVSALWALGYSSSEAIKICDEYNKINKIKKIDFITALTFFHMPFTNYKKGRALLRTKHVRQYFESLFDNKKIEDLPIKTLFQTTNIDEGESFIVRKGKLADAVYASSAMLPFYPPIEMEHRWLGDANMSTGLPLKVIIEENVDLIVYVEGNSLCLKNPRHLISSYSSFVKNAISYASRPRTALLYDLHHDELIIIPVIMNSLPGKMSKSIADDVVIEARKGILKHANDILSHI